MKSKLFEKSFDESLNVTYIGMTCDNEESVKSLGSLADSGCRRAQETTTVQPKEKESKKNGSKTDECYVELNDFVLEGTAIAVETAVTAEVLSFVLYWNNLSDLFRNANASAQKGRSCMERIVLRSCTIMTARPAWSTSRTDSPTRKSSTLSLASTSREATLNGLVLTRILQETSI